MFGYGFDVDPQGNPWGTDFMGGRIWASMSRRTREWRSRCLAAPRPFLAADESMTRAASGSRTTARKRSHVRHEDEDLQGVEGRSAVQHAVHLLNAGREGARVPASNTCDCIFRVDTKNGTVLEIPMPSPVNSFDAKRVSGIQRRRGRCCCLRTHATRN